eukprot:9473634-Pyramimonas_sp.AAC.1
MFLNVHLEAIHLNIEAPHLVRANDAILRQDYMCYRDKYNGCMLGAETNGLCNYENYFETRKSRSNSRTLFQLFVYIA